MLPGLDWLIFEGVFHRWAVAASALPAWAQLSDPEQSGGDSERSGVAFAANPVTVTIESIIVVSDHTNCHANLGAVDVVSDRNAG